MGWFRRAGTGPPPVAKEDLWVICAGCKAHLYKAEWIASLRVCAKCQYHDRISFRERLDLLLDPGTFHELDSDITTADPLGFADASGRYADKAAEAKAKSGMKESIVTGRGRMNGMPVVVGVMDFQFLGGSLGGGTGTKIRLAAEYALRHRYPYIVVSASGGARMHEGIVSLMQMAKTCASIARLQRERVPYVSVLTHPTTGGVSASFAMMGDLNIAEPGALIGFAGRRVIEQTIKQKLPDDFQTAEYLLEHGFIDRIVPRKEMKDFLHRALQYWRRG